MFMFARSSDNTQLMPYALMLTSDDKWGVEGVGAVDGGLNLICET